MDKAKLEYVVNNEATASRTRLEDMYTWFDEAVRSRPWSWTAKLNTSDKEFLCFYFLA
jgi:hypothetical protein